MAMFAPIPMPSNDNHQFKDVMDYFLQLKEMSQKQPLIEAQAKQQNAEAGRLEELAKLPFAGRELPGAAGKALAMSMIKTKYGANSPEYQEASNLYNLEKQRAVQTMNYQQSLMDTQSKRFATPMAKLAQEQAEINQGVMPGTSIGGRPGQPLNSEQQSKLKGQYNLKTLKDTTDVGVRQRILYSKNMEKTLNNLPVDDLTSYSGLKGTGELIKDSIAANTEGTITPRYQKYNEALTAAQTLAKQVRQFYGDSITPGVQEGLKKLTNPTTWLKHPKIAKAQFNRFKNILQTEAKTFTDAAKNANIYEQEMPEGNYQNSSPKGLTYNMQTGEFE